jgi:hypothetical protein
VTSFAPMTALDRTRAQKPDEPEKEERRSAKAAANAIDRLLTSRSLVFVTGKGGVGKSVVSAALALRARHLGLRPLLFECDAPLRQSLFPGGARSTAEVSEVFPGVLAVNQSSDEAIKAYAMHALPSKTLAELMLENRVSRLFLKASPSVTEMALIGRMVQMAEENADNGPVIVDLHSTGHALHVLRAPQGIMRVLRKGPVYDRAKAANDFIFDKDRATVLTVALPEELPVTELLEVLVQLNDIGAPLGPVLMNGMFTDPLPTFSDAALRRLAEKVPAAHRACADAQALRQWSDRAARERARLEEGLRGREGDASHVLPLPYIMNLAADESLATRIAACFEAAQKGSPISEVADAG